jgi:signal transduction histidine kinase
MLAAIFAVALVATALLWILLAGNTPSTAPRNDHTGTSTSLTGIGPVSLGLAAAAAWLAAASLTRWQLAQRLRDARGETQALQQLLDVWQWQTDRDHHLVRLQPPHGAPASAWAGRAAGQRLWERFGGGDADSLRERMAARSLLLDVGAAQAGGTRWLRGLPRFDAQGAFAGYVGTARAVDVSSTMEPGGVAAGAAEVFSCAVSHELRAPVRVVEGFARILKEDDGHALDRIGNDHLDRVLGAAARMNGMIDALLALARLAAQPLARQPMNLSQLALYVVDELKRASPTRTVQVHIEPGLAASGDATLLRVVLENLLDIAWKYCAQADAAQIKLQRVEHHGHDCFAVRDNGAGFDMRFADRLFGPFQRLHSANDDPGTGIGLASVKRIVRRYGGEAWGESEVGKGASFYFTLPR